VNPTSNYGSATTLQVDNSPVKHFLLKFDVTGVNGQTITNAKIRLYNVDAASAGGKFYRVGDNTSQEETVTWNNAPAADTTLLAPLGSVSVNTWYEVDVTSLVTGDGTYSVRISDSTGGADYSSKEGTNPPPSLRAAGFILCLLGLRSHLEKLSVPGRLRTGSPLYPSAYQSRSGRDMVC
jgi:hypothetical protein